MDDELHHKNIAYELGATKKGLYYGLHNLKESDHVFSSLTYFALCVALKGFNPNDIYF